MGFLPVEAIDLRRHAFLMFAWNEPYSERIGFTTERNIGWGALILCPRYHVIDYFREGQKVGRALVESDAVPPGVRSLASRRWQ
jgi:hypothetical protein